MPTCLCKERACVEAGSYLFVDGGVLICAAGCVYESVGEPAQENVFENHVYLTSNDKNALATSTQAGTDRPLALRSGREKTDMRVIVDIANSAQLPDGVAVRAKSILEATYEEKSKEFKRRGMKRQALIVAIVCMACDRSNIDRQGERLRHMCESAIGKAACANAKTYMTFCRIVRAMGIILNRVMSVSLVHAGPEEAYTMRIINSAWGRLGRIGMVDTDIASITNIASAISREWENASTKLADALIPCAAYTLYGSNDSRTTLVCSEYDYRKMTISNHCKTISNFYTPSNNERIIQ